MADHEPEEGEQYRNKNTIPGYSPGNLIIELSGVDWTQGMVHYTTVESNRLRTGPFIGLEQSMSMQALENDWEFMPQQEADVLVDHGTTGDVAPVDPGETYDYTEVGEQV